MCPEMSAIRKQVGCAAESIVPRKRREVATGITIGLGPLPRLPAADGRPELRRRAIRRARFSRERG